MSGRMAIDRGNAVCAWTEAVPTRTRYPCPVNLPPPFKPVFGISRNTFGPAAIPVPVRFWHRQLGA